MNFPRSPIFFTFYSFKGGVGRSMALLNCAYLLAGYGRRVLMIDFDLEAPGLTFLAARESERVSGEGVELREGLLEIIADFCRDPTHWRLQDAANSDALASYLVDLSVPDSVTTTETPGRLSILPAGNVSMDYAGRLSGLDWNKAPLSEHRENLVRHLRNLIRQSGLFDYILIDARTGWSDEAYLTSRFMADHLVVLSGLNDQNLLGTSEYLKTVSAWTAEEKDRSSSQKVILVASPVPEWEEDAKEKRLVEAYALLKTNTGEDIKFSHQLSYHPRLALREEAIVANWPDSSLARGYTRLCQSLQRLNRDTSEDWYQGVSSIKIPSGDDAASFDGSGFLASVHALFGLDRHLAKAASELLQTKLEVRGRELMNKGLASEAIPLFDASVEASRLLNGKEQLSRGLFYRSDCQRFFGDYDAARKGYEESLAIFRELGNKSWIAATFHSLAILDRRRGDYETARKGYEESLAIDHELSNKQGIAATFHSLAELDRLRGDYETARKGYEESLAINRELGNKQGIGATLHALAELDSLKGDYETARKGYQESLAIKRELGNKRGIALTLHSSAELDRLRGDYETARKGFEESLAIKHELGENREVAVTLHSLAELDRLKGDYETARKGYQESLAIKRELGEKREIAVTSLHLAFVRALTDERNLATLAEEVSRAREISDPGVRVRGLNMLSEAYAQYLRFSESLEHASEAFESSQRLGLDGILAEANTHFAVASEQLGDHANARAAAESALSFFEDHSVHNYLRDQVTDLLARSSDNRD